MVYPLLFLIDVDNTLLDNDRIEQDVSDHLTHAFGREACDRYWGILERLRADEAVENVDKLPGQYRFFAGGDRSVRGFGYDELSPVTYSPGTGQAQRVGGRHLLTGTLELQRVLPHNLAIAGFTDFGNALNEFSDPLAFSVGIGVRWLLPGITLGLDVAQAVRAPGFDHLPGPRLHVNISPRSVK